MRIDRVLKDKAEDCYCGVEETAAAIGKWYMFSLRYGNLAM